MIIYLILIVYILLCVYILERFEKEWRWLKYGFVFFFVWLFIWYVILWDKYILPNISFNSLSNSEYINLFTKYFVLAWSEEIFKLLIPFIFLLLFNWFKTDNKKRKYMTYLFFSSVLFIIVENFLYTYNIYISWDSSSQKEAYLLALNFFRVSISWAVHMLEFLILTFLILTNKWSKFNLLIAFIVIVLLHTMFNFLLQYWTMSHLLLYFLWSLYLGSRLMEELKKIS